MNKHKRRRFLLFMSHIGTSILISPTSMCSNPNSTENKRKEDMSPLKDQIIEILNSGKRITLKWNCGGDEAIVTTFVDGKQVSYNDKFAEELDIYIVNYLDLPDVGEFQMEGEGEIVEENGKVYLECESTLLGYEGYTDEGKSEGWVKTNTREDEYSGKRKLFMSKE
ncbi:MAG: hypothetical protein AAGI07_00455 [Bacteroidota bacterium]